MITRIYDWKHDFLVDPAILRVFGNLLLSHQVFSYPSGLIVHLVQGHVGNKSVLLYPISYLLIS